MVRVTLPDGSNIEVAEGTPVVDVAARISPGLAKAAIAAKVDDEIVDLSRPVTRDCRLQILKPDADNPDRNL